MIRKLAVLGFSIFTSMLIYAAAPSWVVETNTSKLNFTATQNNAPVSGEFTSFKSEIKFAPEELDSSQVHIVIATDSITTSYKTLQDTLKTADWFNVKQFPQAEFIAQSFTKTGSNTYTANGKLTLKGKTQPVVLNFTLQEYSPTHAVVKGQTQINRRDFDIGQGEWASTAQIKDQVQIAFVIVADKG